MLWAILAAIGLGFLMVAPLRIDRDVAYVLAPVAVMLTLPFYNAVCHWLEGCPAVCRIARVVAITSITYLALQNYLIGVIKILLGKMMGPQLWDDNLLLKVAVALAVMAILYPIAIFIDRRLPWLLGKKSSTL